MTGSKVRHRGRRSQDGAMTFEEIVDVLEARARHLLGKEARLGPARELLGRARLSDEELRGRLARLRDHVAICLSQARSLTEATVARSDDAKIVALLTSASRRLSGVRFALIRPKALFARLFRLWRLLDKALASVEAELAGLASRLGPEQRLDLLTVQELEALFRHGREARRLMDLQRLEDLLRSGKAEARNLFVTRFCAHGTSEPGRLAHRRGRWIAAHLIGVAEGLGLSAGHSSGALEPESGAHALAIVVSRLRAARGDWGDDPAAGAVLAEMPRARNDEVPPADLALSIKRRLLGPDPFLDEARAQGRAFGEAIRQTQDQCRG